MKAPVISNTIQGRYFGAMFGLAVADALGAPAEFQKREYVQEKWGVLNKMVGSNIWAVGEWTDDTGMALCIAHGIQKDYLNPIEAIGQNFHEWRRTTKDCGNTISASLANHKMMPEPKNWFEASQRTYKQFHGRLASNGSLMRCLPVALAYPANNAALLIQQSAQISAMTHWDSQAEACCLIYCFFVQALMQDRKPLDAWKRALDRVEALQELALIANTPGLSGLPAEFWPRLRNVNSLTYDQLQPSGYAGYVVECLEAAVWCVLNAQSFDDGVIKAVNLAGEADTIGAVAGGALGAYYGYEQINTEWLEVLMSGDVIAEAAQNLYDLSWKAAEK